MQANASTRGDREGTAVDSWPWECLDCGATIYHDGECCLACASAHRAGGRERRNDAPEGFVDWMRNEPVSGYVLKVTAVAGAEVALTALWLQVLVGGTTALDLLAPLA